MCTRFPALLLGLFLSAGPLLLPPPALAGAPAKEWPAEVEEALSRAGANRRELVKALKATPPDQRQGMNFLLANMPDRDLRSLRADFLLENLSLAYRARGEVPWGRQIPEELFLDDVLPYANLDEARDPWRKQLYDLCLPLVKDCRTPGEAAQKLNATIFPKLGVRFSTARKMAQQSPKETIELGLASCTGLSILLSDACRSVAIPARVVGTPLWADRSGNHSWVEVWDEGWHFTGAAEPDARGLDHAWFEQAASRAQADSPLHAIYAAGFRRTGLAFPMVWAPGRKDVPAENVSARYAAGQGRGRAGKGELSPEQLQEVEKAAREFFAADEARRSKWEFAEPLDRSLEDHEGAVRRAVWKAYQEAPIHKALKKDFEKHQVRHGDYLSPYTVRAVGKRPEKGWPLFVALHGGGGAPKQVNDSQWLQMQHYYRDQDSVTGYLYLALRAPNDLWNGFYDDYVPPLVVNLVRQFLLFGDVDPDKVFLMGYSHGGYGAFFIGPKIPDRFAAVHASAAAPTEGTISARTLRNTRFTFMVGERDNAYGRRQRCEAFDKEVQKLREQNPGAYPVEMELKKGYGHGGLPDRDKIREMYSYTRNPVPRHLTWDLTDSVVKAFFWLAVPEPAKDESIDAVIEDNTIRITTRNVKEFDLDLDGRLVSYDRPLRLVVDGQARELRLRPRFVTLCRSMLERGDPELAFTCRAPVKAGQK